MNLHSFLAALVVLLAVLIVATSVFQKLRLGSVIGLIVAGVALGPWGLHIAPHVDRLLNFTELGVVLLMFTIGLEMAPKKLWTIRKLVFGLGILQVVVTGAFLTLALLTKDYPWRGSLLGGIGLALSSTAFGMQILQERHETTTPYGEASFAILLAQDLAIVPLLALFSGTMFRVRSRQRDSDRSAALECRRVWFRVVRCCSSSRDHERGRLQLGRLNHFHLHGHDTGHGQSERCPLRKFLCSEANLNSCQCRISCQCQWPVISEQTCFRECFRILVFLTTEN